MEKSLYMLANFFLRAAFECEFPDMPGSYGELIPQFLIKLPDRIPTAIVYAAAYVPLLNAMHRWLEEPTLVFEEDSAIEYLVMDIALKLGYSSGEVTNIDTFRQRRRANTEKLKQQR